LYAARHRFIGDALHPLVINRLEVVLEEVVSNILRPGSTPGSGQSIAIRVAARPGVVVLRR
jgi:hypothetical protein